MNSWTNKLRKDNKREQNSITWLSSIHIIHSKTYDGFAKNDRDLPILIPLQSQIDDWLEIISYVYEGTNTI